MHKIYENKKIQLFFHVAEILFKTHPYLQYIQFVQVQTNRFHLV